MLKRQTFWVEERKDGSRDVLFICFQPLLGTATLCHCDVNG